jgi:hypothetical protein
MSAAFDWFMIALRLHRALERERQLSADLCQRMQMFEARVAELRDELDAEREKHLNAGRKRKSDDELSERAMRYRKQEDRERAEIEARNAQLSPIIRIRHKFTAEIVDEDDE